jgi:hypothetical protein
LVWGCWISTKGCFQAKYIKENIAIAGVIVKTKLLRPPRSTAGSALGGKRPDFGSTWQALLFLGFDGKMD